MMKNVFHYLPWVLLLVACAPPSETQLVKDREGRVRAEVTRVQGRKEGPVRFFHTNGSLETTGTYAHDSRHGAWTTVGPAGDTLSIVTFHRGKKDGLQAYWNTQGQLMRLERFSQGEPHGPLYRFFADGSPRQISWFEHGTAEGTYMEWYKVDSSSVALSAGRYRKGERDGRWAWFYGNGKPQALGHYVDGKRVGTWYWWNPQGTLVKKVEQPR